MGLDFVVLFCVGYAGVVLTGMWFYLTPGLQKNRPKFLSVHPDFTDENEDAAPSARILEFRAKKIR